MILNPYDWLNKLYRFYVVALVSIISRHGLTIEAHCWNQCNKNKLSLCKPWIHFNGHVKQLYKSNKTERFSYKGGCGICGHTCIKIFKRWLGLQITLKLSSFYNIEKHVKHTLILEVNYGWYVHITNFGLIAHQRILALYIWSKTYKISFVLI